MLKSKNYVTNHWQPFLLILFLAQPLYGSDSFRIDPIRDLAPPAYSVMNAGSWEDFKRIKQGGSRKADTTADSDGAEIAAAPTKQDNTTAPNLQQAPIAPPVQQATPAPAVTPAPQLTAAPQGQANVPKPAVGKPAPELITAPAEPTEQGSWWAFYIGAMAIHANPFYDPHGVDYKWAYSRKNPLPKDPRIVVLMHGSGAGVGAIMWAFGPSPRGDIEVRVQDAEAQNSDWREWWTFGRDGTPYPGRRIAAALDFLINRYGIDTSSRGIVLDGPSMGGAGAVIQTMILPDPWRSRIAYSSARAGVIMPRQIAKRDAAQYITFPTDDDSNRALWDSIDFSIQAAADPIVRGIHYRHAFSSDDQFSAGVDGNTQLDFVNLVEQYKIGGAFTWVKAGHGTFEEGVALPEISEFESPEQDVTLDRAHPAITNSTGNYPILAVDRANEEQFPRGHYNMGITWNHADIVDDSTQIIFPLKYSRRTGIGKGVPDQPLKITVSVTPRRPRNFAISEGEILKWSWDNGALSGVATVTGDTVTIDGVHLVSGDQYKTLRIYR